MPVDWNTVTIQPIKAVGKGIRSRSPIKLTRTPMGSISNTLLLLACAHFSLSPTFSLLEGAKVLYQQF